MDAGIDELNGKDLGNARNRVAGQPSRRLSVGVLATCRQPPPCRFHLTNDAKKLGARPKQFVSIVGSKRARMAQKENGFEQARFTCGIVAEDPSAPGIEAQLSCFNAPEILYCNLGQHAVLAPAFTGASA